MDMRRFGRMDYLRRFESFGEEAYFVSARVLADTTLFGTLPYIERAAGKAWGYTSVQFGNMMLKEGQEPLEFDYGDPIFQGDLKQNMLSGFETGAGFYIFGKFSQRAFLPRQKKRMMRQYTSLRKSTRVLRIELERDLLKSDYPVFGLKNERDLEKMSEADLLKIWESYLDWKPLETGIRTPNGLIRNKVYEDMGWHLGLTAEQVKRKAGYLAVKAEEYKKIPEAQKKWDKKPVVQFDRKTVIKRRGPRPEFPVAQRRIYELYRTIKESQRDRSKESEAIEDADIILPIRDIVAEVRELLVIANTKNKKILDAEALEAAEDITLIYDKIIEIRLDLYIKLKGVSAERKTKELQKALHRILDHAESYGYGKKRTKKRKKAKKRPTL